MNTLKPFLTLSLIFINSCVTISDKIGCSAAGDITKGAGAICAHTNSDVTSTLSFSEFLDFLTAQPERTCVPVPGMNVCADDQTHGEKAVLPARGASIVMSDLDVNEGKTSLEVLCRMAGKRCSYDTPE